MSTTKTGSFRLNLEKQESLVKLGILVLASILCKLSKNQKMKEKMKILNFFPAFSTRLFSVLRFESVIHEFDPYFNYRTTKYLTEKGFYNFHNW